MECVVVGVDGGASRSAFLAFDASRLEAARWRGPALSVFYKDLGAIADGIRRGVWGALRLLGAERVAGVYAGLAGMDAGRASVKRARIVEAQAPFPLVVDHDAFIAWWTSWIEGGEAAVIAGTGSIILHYDLETGRRLLLGNHGPLLGDQGSAFEIGYAALKRLGEALQGLARWTCLEEALTSRLGLRDDEEAAAWAYFREGLVPAAAEAARVTLDAADAGCAAAAEIARSTALRLARLIDLASRRWGVRVFRVYGGLTKSRVYVEALKAGAGDALVEVGGLDPAVGAVWLAVQYYCDNLTVTPWEVASATVNLNS